MTRRNTKAGANVRDKYGFRDLGVGESNTVEGAKLRTVQTMLYTYNRRHEFMIHRDYVLTTVEGGVKIERVR